MLRRFAALQFTLVFLPLCVYGLGVYGSDFDAASGRLLLGLFLSLPLIDLLLGARLERLAGTGWERVLVLATVLLAGWAYAPLHLAYWDEHSTRQALRLSIFGLCAYAVSRVASVAREGDKVGRPEPSRGGALVLVAAAWASAWLYPLAPLLATGLILAAYAQRPSTAPRPGGPSRARVGGFEALAAACLGVEVFLPLWDYQWLGGGALLLAASLVGSALGYSAPARLARLWSGLAVAAALGAALAPELVISPLHALLVGPALGALLARVERLGPYRAPLGGLSVSWFLGVGLGLALYLNLYWAPLRLVLLVPLALVFRARTRASQETAPPSEASTSAS